MSGLGASRLAAFSSQEARAARRPRRAAKARSAAKARGGADLPAGESLWKNMLVVLPLPRPLREEQPPPLPHQRPPQAPSLLVLVGE